MTTAKDLITKLGSTQTWEVREPLSALAEIDLVEVTHDSRTVTSGALFCALSGERFDGHNFVDLAAGNGAGAALVERWVDSEVPQIRVPNSRVAMALAAAEIYQNPSRRLKLVGITGTNGKTTTTQMVESIVAAADLQTTVIGTLQGTFTTPESPEFQRTLRDAADSGVDVVAAEISSHALAQHRVDGATFAVAAFSNLTQDHLDFHQDMESYFEAKATLFDGRATQEIINVDDAYGQRLAERRPHAQTVSLDDVTIGAVGLDGSDLVWRGLSMRVPLPGRMNVSNALLAAEIALAIGIDAETVVNGIGSLPPVPGRMQRIVVSGLDASQHPVVIVDYSHTPDSLSRALASVRNAEPTARIGVVFGCAGDRDSKKRPLMAAAAEAGADVVIVTSDNPRSEDPATIVAEVATGLRNPEAAIIEVDRYEAIRAGIGAMSPGEVLIIAGKGHETTQTIGEQVFSFDDRSVAAEVLREAYT